MRADKTLFEQQIEQYIAREAENMKEQVKNIILEDYKIEIDDYEVEIEVKVEIKKAN